MSTQEADFSLHELFFSKTNKKGVIESGNSVFIRVSEFEREELLHKPHNIIRNADTPRSVFKLFWEFLDAGRPIAAYVKNRSKTGRYYWVFAMAFPLADGYLSIRLKPSSKYFSVVKDLYQALISEEANGLDLSKGIELIETKIRELGFLDYADFMTRALVEEMSSRDQLLEAYKKTDGKARIQIQKLEAFIQNSMLNTHAARLSYSKTSNLFTKTAVLLKECQEILETCHRVKFVTVNLMVASSRLQEAGKPLGAVAMNLQELTTQIAKSSARFEEVFKDYEKSVFEMFVAVAISRFQIEMMNQLAEETVLSCESSADFDGAKELDFNQNCSPLRQLIGENFQVVGRTFQNLDNMTRSLLESIQTLNKVTSGMGVLHVVGKIEMVRVGAGESLGARLAEMDALNQVFKKTLGNLERECKLNAEICDELKDHEQEIKLRLVNT
ncbi:PAS domain-containing protein [Bdellovibrio sp. HCB209]|uniref:PAS domain-containing protein n=1 Tax=Bdellovibrio sp. HCB209 TaxID=3394354 RepID=UPI0039B61B7D